MTLGFEIHRRKTIVDADIAEGFRGLPVANVSDSMSRMTAGGPRLRPYHTVTQTTSGPALTVKLRPGDNLLMHAALDMAEPGDMLVVDAGGDLTNAIMGEIMAYIAQENGIAGIVLNGAIRDVQEIARCGLPVWAAGVSHRGPYKDGPGEINTPIAIDGMVIRPGDLILGDADGVLAVPAEEAETVLQATRIKQQAEARDIAAIRDGSIDRNWVATALKARGCTWVD